MMETIGASAATNSIQDSDLAKLIMVVGANPTESHPVVGAQYQAGGAAWRSAHRDRPPAHRAGPFGRSASAIASRHQCGAAKWPGPCDREGRAGRSGFYRARTEGFDDWFKTVEDCTPDLDDAITGVPAHLISEAARLLCQERRVDGSAWPGGDGTPLGKPWGHGAGNLALATGNIGKPGTGINPLRGQNNVQGASDVGCLPTFFAGYQSFDNPELARRITRP